MSEYPPQVQAFHDVLQRFVAVRDVDTGLKAIDDSETSVYSRSGDQIQLRPMALPPKAQEIQLGHTLKFIVDHFAITDGESPVAVLDLLAKRAESLSGNIDDYGDVLTQLTSA